MKEKYSSKTDLDNTKITSLINYRGGGDLTDATRLYRKEQALKKKLKVLLDGNSHLQKEIKNHQSQIKDERASVQFQLSDLIKEMNIKFTCFNEQKLQKEQFSNNEKGHKSIQNMMQKYEQIQKECIMMGKIFESIQKIQMDYRQHSSEMQKMVIQSQTINMQYQNTMQSTIHDTCQQIKTRIKQNEQLDHTTQQLTKEIDSYVQEVVQLKEQQNRLITKIQKLKKMALCQQQKINEITQWADIVIDKNNRKSIQKIIKQKEIYLHKIRQKNNYLQIYLFQLDNQQENVNRMKEQEKIMKENICVEKVKNKNKSKGKGGSKKVSPNKY